ncbi:hypothetical protein C2869_08555 [Saccharobesus litoralis]|uniref:HemY N-terminal domain-containing protein n=1 Tax=Saccharobesus litoralis TaxID=2172099 RepID=A0A2S0VQI2_9ALTE|nr:heme biosynthesis HemY N-terminal domain-containing protein [Saccharobesus litoralis]AWB66475.1 hypothetical protein C2869_08555 [Saccharobesus litoralis]
MIRLIGLFLVFSIVLFIGSTFWGDKGYVLIAMGQTTLETTVVALGLMMVFGYFALRIVLNIVFGLFHAGQLTRDWRKKRRYSKVLTKFETAFEALLNHEYAAAEKLSCQTAEISPIKKSHYLLAAEAAKQQGEYERQAQYSLRAVEQGSEIEKQLAIAHTLKEEGQINKAIEKTEALLKKDPKQSQTLVLLAMLYNEAGRYLALSELLKRVKQYTNLPSEIFENFVKNAYQGLYQDAVQVKDLKQIHRLYAAVNKISEWPDKLSCLYVNAMIQAGFAADAEKFILKAAKSQLTPELLETIKRVPFPQPLKLIAWLEQEIKKSPDNMLLVSALGYVACGARDWQLARKALDIVIRHEPSAEHYFKLADVLEHLQQPQQALSCYKKGVKLAA